MWALLGLIALAVGAPEEETADRDLEARARARAAHRRRRVRLRRHDGPARRGRGRGALPRLLDRDPLAAARLRARHARPRGARGDGELGIPEAQLRVHDFDVRTFPERRQDILELLVGLWEELKPDAVFQPSHHDVHQDHQTIAQEGLRAFKRTTVLGYEIPWNNFDFSYGAYVGLEQRHLERKVAALGRTPRSSTAATRTPSTSGTSPGCTASTSTASTRSSSRSTGSSPSRPLEPLDPGAAVVVEVDHHVEPALPRSTTRSRVPARRSRSRSRSRTRSATDSPGLASPARAAADDGARRMARVGVARMPRAVRLLQAGADASRRAEPRRAPAALEIS